jgi:hypothetical protein
VDLTQQHLHEPGAGDGGSIVISWITKLAIVAAIVGTLGFDGISVGLGHLSTAGDADNAVQAASQNFQTTHNLTAAYQAAVAAIKPKETVGVTNFTVAADGTASLTVTNTVHTLVFFRTSETKKWTVITAHASGKYTGQ